MSRSKTKQKRSSAVKNVTVFFIVFVILEVLIMYGLSKVFSNEDKVIGIFGYNLFIMDSDNMGEVAPKDSLVIADSTTPSPGNAALCRNVGNEGTTVAWLLEAGSKGDTVDGIVYTVYQEKDTEKKYDIKSEDIIGVATSYYSTAGKIIKFVTMPVGMGICAAVPLVLMILIDIIIAVSRRPVRDDDYYDDEEDDYRNSTDNVTLDDFLYGGENDSVYSAAKPKSSYEEEFGAVKTPAPAYEDKAEDRAEPAEEMPAPQPAVPQTNFFAEPAPEEAEQVPNEYRENIQEAETEQTADEPMEQQTAEQTAEEQKIPEMSGAAADTAAAKRPAQSHAPAQNQVRKKRPPQRAPRPIPSASRRNANETLEQLMKLMEEEQKKLRSETDDNN